MMGHFFHASLMISILLCALVAGLVFSFSVVVMPGIAKSTDRDFLIAFRNIDEVIQKNQPLFMLVWVGSIFVVLATFALGTLYLSGVERLLLWFGSAVYLLGVQLPTAIYNIPLNNELQDFDVMTSSDSELAEFRTEFEPSWNKWNKFRTMNSIVAVSTWVFLLFQL